MLRRGRFDTVLGPVVFDDKGDLEDGAWQWQVWRDGSYQPLSESSDDARAPAGPSRSARDAPPRTAADPS
jgi:hypothetical protein